jgi:hypothetical protein
MRRLILHIGSHKTGSTSIQKFLLKNRNSLKEIGWILFCERPDGTESVHGNANSWVSFSGEKKEFKAKLDKRLFSALNETTGNMIISCEELSWLYQSEEIQYVFDELSQIFNDIKVICYIRRQDKHLLSHYHQGFRYPHSSARDFFGNNICIVPTHLKYYQNYLDYTEKLSCWAVSFGGNNLYVREFSRDKFEGENVVSDFLKILNLNIKLDPDDESEPVNESLNLIQTIVNYAVFNSRNELWYELGRRKFTGNMAFHSDNKPQLDQASQNAIMVNYYVTNKKLSKYVPDLSSSWVSPTPELMEKLDAFKPMPEEEYKNAVQAIVSYYDGLSVLGFVKIKYRRFVESHWGKRNIR